MANADIALQSPVLASNQSDGVSIQNTGGGDTELIKLRDKATGGTVSLTKTLLNAIVTNGVINVKDCPTIAVFHDFTKGSLINVGFTFEFSDNDEVNWFELLAYNRTTSSIKSAGINQTVTGLFVFSIDNPGATRMRVSVQGAGTITASSLGVWIGRGFGRGYNS